MPASEFEQVAFSASLDCRYLLHVPQVVDPTTPALVALHGYASNPDDILGFTKMVAGADSVIAAIQAPHQQYLPQNGSGTLPGPGAKTGYNWGVGVHWKSAVALHHAMVLRVLESLRSRFGTPANRLILLGFSQPVGLNYRFAATHPDSIGGVIGICGGIPKDWEEGPYQPVSAPILHISRDEDPFYPVPAVMEFEKRFLLRATDVEFHLLPGAHRFPSKGGVIIRPWLERVLGGRE